jgi:hypothetical protein
MAFGRRGRGGLAALAGGLALALGVAPGAAAAVAVGTQAMVTGALHEDGLADSADGLWGGWDKTRRLAIMKDSHIGTYGVLALILVMLLRWTALAALFAQGTPWAALIAAGALSRAPMAVLMAALPNARGTGLSHSVGRPDGVTAATAWRWPVLIGAAALGSACRPDGGGGGADRAGQDRRPDRRYPGGHAATVRGGRADCHRGVTARMKKPQPEGCGSIRSHGASQAARDTGTRLLHRHRDFAGQALQRRFVKLTLGIALLALVVGAVQVAHHLGDGHQIARVDLLFIFLRAARPHGALDLGLALERIQRLGHHIGRRQRRMPISVALWVGTRRVILSFSNEITNSSSDMPAISCSSIDMILPTPCAG